ncbi:MAG: H-X9-DG-CTERM domain-containing protein [Armatimonadota bacterium]
MRKPIHEYLPHHQKTCTAKTDAAGANVAFVDGHAKWVKVPGPDEMTEGQPYNIPGLRFRP